MSKKRRLFAFILLIAYCLSTSGCAVAWFLVGAGTAATSMAVIDENKNKEGDLK
ncbi:hypothetical protein ACFL4E_00410 [Candidatus Omnitrophota bacterium]